MNAESAAGSSASASSAQSGAAASDFAAPSGIQIPGMFREQFVSETVTPCDTAFDGGAMAQGAPGVPLRFLWRGEEVRVRSVLASSKTLRPCRNGSSDRYIDKHIYRVETEDGRVMTLYRRRNGKRRDTWTLYTVENRQ